MGQRVHRALSATRVLSVREDLATHVRRRLVAGVLLLAPLLLTFLVLKLSFDVLDGLLQPLFVALVGREVPGVGLLGLLVLVYIVGTVGAVKGGQRLVRLIHIVLLNFPLVRTVFSLSKQLTDVLSGAQTAEGTRRVVVIEYPRAGLWAIGFLTALATDENGRSLAIVYIPTAPMPNSGWVAVLPTEDVYETDLSVQEASQLVLSGGILAPQKLAKRPMHQSIVDTLRSQIRRQEMELEARRRQLEEYAQSLIARPSADLVHGASPQPADQQQQQQEPHQRMRFRMSGWRRSADSPTLSPGRETRRALDRRDPDQQ